MNLPKNCKIAFSENFAIDDYDGICSSFEIRYY